MILQSITSKYFIIRPGPRNGPVMHGQILGPMNDLGLFYLCDLYAVDPVNSYCPKSQSIIPIEALAGANLYDDRVIWLEEWRTIFAAITDASKAVEKVKRSNMRKFNQALKAGKVSIVAGDQVEGESLLKSLLDEFGAEE